MHHFGAKHIREEREGGLSGVVKPPNVGVCKANNSFYNEHFRYQRHEKVVKENNESHWMRKRQWQSYFSISLSNRKAYEQFFSLIFWLLSLIKKIWKELPLPALREPNFLIKTSKYSGISVSISSSSILWTHPRTALTRTLLHKAFFMAFEQVKLTGCHHTIW